jgi:hypothetical protein
MTYRVVRQFGAHQPGDTVHDDGNLNVGYLLGAGMIEATENSSDDTKTVAPHGRTKTSKRKPKE